MTYCTQCGSRLDNRRGALTAVRTIESWSSGSSRLNVTSISRTDGKFSSKDDCTMANTQSNPTDAKNTARRLSLFLGASSADAKTTEPLDDADLVAKSDVPSRTERMAVQTARPANRSRDRNVGK
jgi:hypothetical protein